MDIYVYIYIYEYTYVPISIHTCIHYTTLHYIKMHYITLHTYKYCIIAWISPISAYPAHAFCSEVIQPPSGSFGLSFQVPSLRDHLQPCLCGL